jgi:hypothetical protein
MPTLNDLILPLLYLILSETLNTQYSTLNTQPSMLNNSKINDTRFVLLNDVLFFLIISLDFRSFEMLKMTFLKRFLENKSAIDVRITFLFPDKPFSWLIEISATLSNTSLQCVFE